MFFIGIFLLSFLINFLQADFDHFASRNDMTWNDKNICNLYKAEVISEEEYPKSRLFLQNLIQKYPQEFDNVSFYMVRSGSPFAGCGIIGIPYQWLVMLENEISVAQKWTEWALLHEAGHIHHQHVKVLSCLKIAEVIFIDFTFSLWMMNVVMSMQDNKNYLNIFNYKFFQEDIAKAIKFGCIGILSCAVSSILYSKYIAEPQADSFAAKKCQNKEVLESGAVFLDKCSLDNLLYPPVKDRIAKINHAIEKRFKNKS